jgi:hypothetical protein
MVDFIREYILLSEISIFLKRINEQDLKQSSNISLISVVNLGTNLDQQEAHQATKDPESEPIN